MGDGTISDETKQDLLPEADQGMCRDGGQKCELRRPYTVPRETDTTVGKVKSTKSSKVKRTELPHRKTLLLSDFVTDLPWYRNTAMLSHLFPLASSVALIARTAYYRLVAQRSKRSQLRPSSRSTLYASQSYLNR